MSIRPRLVDELIISNTWLSEEIVALERQLTQAWCRAGSRPIVVPERDLHEPPRNRGKRG